MDKNRAYQILELATEKDDIQSRICDYIIMGCIYINILCLIVETIPNLPKQLNYIFHIVEAFSIAVFTVEYFLRLWAIGATAPYKGVVGRIKYILSPMALIDLMAILPFYFFQGNGQILRVFRLLRIFKMIRYSKAMKDFLLVVYSKKDEFIACGIILGLYLVFSSCLMFFLEHEAQPKAFSSIPSTMWWSVVTLTTVGYGDMAPVTVTGKIVGAFIAISGIGLFALPTCILGSSFIEKVISDKDFDKDK